MNSGTKDDIKFLLSIALWISVAFVIVVLVLYGINVATPVGGLYRAECPAGSYLVERHGGSVYDFYTTLEGAEIDFPENTCVFTKLDG